MSVPEGRLAPIRTPIGSDPENATMQLLHHTCRSRIDRLNVAAVTGGSSGKYGDQQRFSASTSSATSSVRQKRYELISVRGSPSPGPPYTLARGGPTPRSARVARLLFARSSLQSVSFRTG